MIRVLLFLCGLMMTLNCHADAAPALQHVCYKGIVQPDDGAGVELFKEKWHAAFRGTFCLDIAIQEVNGKYDVDYRFGATDKVTHVSGRVPKSVLLSMHDPSVPAFDSCYTPPGDHQCYATYRYTEQLDIVLSRINPLDVRGLEIEARLIKWTLFTDTGLGWTVKYQAQ
jgi:hypothetical protein